MLFLDEKHPFYFVQKWKRRNDYGNRKLLYRLQPPGPALGGPRYGAAHCGLPLYPVPHVGQVHRDHSGSLEKTNTSAVWSETDALSTVYRGKLPYVADAVQALFLNAYRPGVHMALEGQFSKGCPGDVSGDSVLNREGEAPNAALVKDIHFPVHCKLALYPLGDAQYIDEIAKVWHMAQDEGLNPKTIHYATRIDGDVQDVFTYLTHVCELMENAPAVHHYVLHFTMNCNSPTEEN